MNETSLKWPYTWEERQVSLEDGVLLVPVYCPNLESFQLPSWPALFERDLPVRIEYCSGNGDWILEKAEEDPSSNWVAVEQRMDRLRKIWKKAKRKQLSNLFLVCSEGYIATHHYFQNATIDEVFINFPDPWPKKRHAKHRIIQKQFLDEMARVLKADAKITIVTDDRDYSSEVIKEFLEHPAFQSIFEAPFFKANPENYGTSYFDNLWRSQGKAIYVISFQKI